MEASIKKLAVAKQVKGKIEELKSPNVKSIILYGSVATRTAKANSDIDMMLLTDFTDMNLLKKIKVICEEFQVKTNEQIALSFNTVSNFLSHIMQGHQMYLNMCIYGNCLLDSVVFDGIIKIIRSSSLPEKEEILTHSKAFIQNQTSVFLGRSMTDFIANIDAIVRRYIHYKEFEKNQITNWIDYEALINHSHFGHLIEMHLSEFADVLETFYSIKHAFSPVYPPQTKHLQNLDLAELVKCVEYIQNQTN